MIRLISADGDERVSSLGNGVRNNVVEFAGLIATKSQTTVDILTFGPNPRAAGMFAQTRQLVDGAAAKLHLGRYILCCMPTPPPQGIHKRSLLRNDVYDSIRDAIVNGTFAPGERLRDPELEAWLGVSRTPIREALLRLERAGLIIAQPGRATIVAPLDAASTVNAQQVVAAMHELAARLAVPLLSEQDLATMTAANVRFAAAIKKNDADAALAADDQFHAVLVGACGNDMVPTMLDQAMPLLRRVERQRFSSHDAQHSVSAHADIIKLATAGDADGAALATRANWLALGIQAVAEETTA
ncbi:DNA-binding GntR family transcriptional regulator [Arthrobacter sp. UYCu511]